MKKPITNNMNIPENIKYTSEHEWIRIEADHAFVGITDYAQGELGDIVFVEVETIGDTLEKGQTFGTIEAVKTVSDMYMPVGGTVVELNDKIVDAPELINKDAYGNGWIIKIKISDPSEAEALLSAGDYKNILES